MLPFALRQVARQRRVEVELVLSTHGFVADPEVVASFRESTDIALTELQSPADLSFGSVLNQAADHASGDVYLKMDDDDWYGRDFTLDLLLAREYSGAEVVGCPPEFIFVEPLWLTTRRRGVTEQYRPVVAGGTMMVDRHLFRALGGFRDTRKYVDAGLLTATTDAGGSVFSSHGLGYVLRRTDQGHTWDPGLGYFVARRRCVGQWHGFRPSRLVDADPIDLPTRPARSADALT
jgi:glycosyltransferase involved in cell wall biosynthesis